MVQEQGCPVSFDANILTAGNCGSTLAVGKSCNLGCVSGTSPTTSVTISCVLNAGAFGPVLSPAPDSIVCKPSTCKVETSVYDSNVDVSACEGKSLGWGEKCALGCVSGTVCTREHEFCPP